MSRCNGKNKMFFKRGVGFFKVAAVFGQILP
jgi:hypothetical protein